MAVFCAVSTLMIDTEGSADTSVNVARQVTTSHDCEKIKCHFDFRLANSARWPQASRGYDTIALLDTFR